VRGAGANAGVGEGFGFGRLLPPARKQVTLRDTPEGRALRGAGAWVVLAMASAFLLIAAVFVAAPALGAAVFGIPAPDEAGLAYVRAVGLRDLALGLYLFGLALFSSRRAVGIVLAATVAIPVGDALLVLAREGLSSPGHLLLHGLSGACCAAVALWLLRREADRAG
jgi:Domain of unknown function (DUF4267)